MYMYDNYKHPRHVTFVPKHVTLYTYNAEHAHAQYSLTSSVYMYS